MKSLFGININWIVYLVLAFLLLLFPGVTTLFYIALLISLHQFLLLFYSIGYVIPIRYLFGSLMCLQFLLGPTLAYSIDITKVQMQIPAANYFNYVTPAVVFFIIGLHITAGNLRGEVLNQDSISAFVSSRKNLPFILIGIGFLASYITGLFSSDIAFLFYLLSSLKFIGVFMIIIGSRRLNIFTLIIVYSSLVISSLGAAMFHDLMTWLIFLGALLAIKYRPSVYVKTIVGVGFVVFTIILQVLKKDYREATWEEGKSAGVETFLKTYDENQSNNIIFNPKNLSQQVVRINQGFIITNIMKTVPAIVPYSEGEELSQVLTAAFLPRFIAPDKLRAGDQYIFTKYTGLQLRPGTSMALSSIGDAYINFGIYGGCLFMFSLGLLYSEVLKFFDTYSKYYPVLLLFAPLAFYYPIRPDCELHTSLGHLVKSCLLIFAIFKIWKYRFRQVSTYQLDRIT